MGKVSRKSQKNKKILFLGIGVTTLIITIVMLGKYSQQQYHIINNTNAIGMAEKNTENNQFIYLSDIPYVEGQSKSGWGNLLKDKTSSDTKITVRIEGAAYSFDKGMWAHATSTLVYDLANYNYDYFTSYIGINTTSSKGNGVIFYIYTSNDGTNWELKEQITKLPATDATFIKVDIKNTRYLKLIADSNGSNGNDHSVYADAKLIKEGYSDGAVEDFSIINRKIQALGDNLNFANPEHELLLLQREFVNNTGEYALKRFVNESPENKETFNWLFNNLENLRMYILGGAPDGGNYYNSLSVLSRLYQKYKADFDIATRTKYGTVLGSLYKKMAISLSLTHSTTVGLWMNNAHDAENQSDAVVRYQIYKDMHQNGKFVISSSLDYTEWFESYTIEEMRYVLNNIIDDPEILWLNEYTQYFLDSNNGNQKYLTPHPYMRYVSPNYGRPEYYDEQYKSQWDEKYRGIFSKYGVPYGTGVQKLWINIESGAVCGGISKLGSNIRAVHGAPSSVISQPGHAAIIYYRKNSDGKGYWTIDNDVSGWAQSGKTERLSIRMPLGWGNDSYVSGWAATYIVLAQEAINDFENYELSEKYIMLAKAYDNNPTKKEEYLRKALSAQRINIDAWWELIKLYKADSSKTESNYYDLAKELGNSLMPFPLPMYNLLEQLRGMFTSTEYSFKFTLLQNRLLNEGKVYAETDRVLQPSITKTVASFLLGQIDTRLATFSFDGDNAGKIILASRFDNNGVRWDYSLDGKKTWKEVSFDAEEEHKHQLSKEELASITAENDIYIHIVGLGYEEENLYQIDIQEQTLPTTLYNNDLENRVVGVNNTYEWRMNEKDSWHSYGTSAPDLTGNKSVQVRIGATSTYLPSNVGTYEFTEDSQPLTRKYIPVSHLSIHEVSTEATGNQGHAVNSIDGNYNTRWHSAWNGTDTQRFITVKFDYPTLLSAVEFVPAGGGNGKIYDGTIYGSMDGENWEILSQKTGLTYTSQANTIEEAIANTKSFEIENPKEVQYVKIVADKTNGNWFTAREFNFYRDITNNPIPTAEIEYSTTDITNQNVIANLTNASTNIKILNNNGKNTYTFTENGEFTFEFVDEFDIVGTTTARVTWIDKETPSVDLEYDKNTLTNQNVTASIKNASETISILNNNGKDTYTFKENGVFEFKYQDQAGNIGTTTAIVDWIDKIAPSADIVYSTTKQTSNPVTVTLTRETEKITILNNDGKNTYTFKENGSFQFEYMDEAGNIGSTIANVSWIEKQTNTNTNTNNTNNTVNNNNNNNNNNNISSNPGNNNTNTTSKPENNSNNTTPSQNNNGIINNTNHIENSNILENNGYISSENNSSNNNGNISENGGYITSENSTSTNQTTENITEYQTYKTDSITLRLPKNTWKEEVSLKSQELTLSKDLEKLLNGQNEYFELYFENAENRKVGLEGIRMEIIINTDSEKTLTGVYEVTDQNELKSLKYQVVENNQIKITTKSLGKYIISYEEKETPKEEEKQPETTTEKILKNQNFIVLAVIAVLVLTALLAVLVVKKRKN